MQPQPYGPPPMPPPRPPSKGVPIAVTIIVAGVSLVVGIGVGAAGSGTGGDTAAAPEATVTKTVTAKPKATAAAVPAGPATTFGDGTYRVGKEIRPGTYKAAGGGGCYWERMRDFKGELGSILANENPSGSTTVTIKASDAGFKTDGCGTWHRL